MTPRATETSLQLSEVKRRLLQQYRQGRPVPAEPGAIRPRPPGTAVPLCYEQERIWLHSQLALDLPLYNELLNVRRTGPLDVSALERAVSEIIRRHEAWRTIFPTVDGVPVQMILPPPTISLPVVDLRGLAEAEREPEALRLATEEARRPFDLIAGPLLRATLIRLADDEHRLYVALHQILFDGVSAFSVFLPELAALYDAFADATASPLPEPTIQYGDFAYWERQQFQVDALSAQLSYWRHQLADARTVLELPTDRRRPAVQTFRGAHATFALPKALTESLKILSQSERVTLFVTLLTAFNVLLYRYSGQEDILVGTLATRRKWPEVEKILGVFMNTLVIRTQLSATLSFRQLLSRQRETTLEALGHGDVPFQLLVKELQSERDRSRNPLFQAMFVLEPSAPSPRPGWHLTQMDVDTGIARVDLHLQLDERPDGIMGRARYNCALFDHVTAVRMVDHFKVLLEGIVTNPDRPLSAIPLQTASERLRVPRHHDLVRPSNRFDAFEEKEVEQSIPQRFEKQVSRYPRRVALRTGRTVWTYHALNQAANRVAQALSTLPGADGSRVALLLDHDASMLAGILGALKAGAAYVPLDPSHPSERLGHILDDSLATAVLTSKANVPRAVELARSSMKILEIEKVLRGAEAVESRRTPSPDQVAYILYTSGSTGRPKGVVQNHRNVLHFIRAYTNNLHICPDDRLTLMSSYSVDAAVMDIFGALLNGATLCPIAIKDVGLSGVCRRLSEEGITIYHSTPTLYRHIVKTLADLPQLTALRLVVLGGEEVQGEDVESYKQHFGPDCILVNGFGPTESTVSLQYFIGKQTGVDRRSVPLGYPVERTVISLLSSDGRPEQVYGEIAIRSPYVALGYWRLPELTRRVFLPDPEGGKDRTYRTGDMGRLLPDGSLEFCGRKDSQVKIRGFRVELGEIEAALLQHPVVKETAAAVCETSDGDRRVVAYWVAAREPAPSTDAIREFLRERLPSPSMPSAFKRVDALPLTPSGKLDRRALVVPDEAHEGHAITAPRNGVELQLTEIWKTLLGIERIGVRDDFFDLGGHSLLAIRMFAEIENKFGVRVPLATLVKAPTIERLAEILRHGGDLQHGHSLVAIQPAGSRPPLFCVHGHFGEVLFYRDLSRRLGADQPFFALQARGLTGQRPHQSIQSMAADYIREIRSVRPAGPYFLGGYCFGAMVAFEMAHQLRAQNQEVGLLALFVGHAPARVRPRLLPFLRRVAENRHAYGRAVATRTRSLVWRSVYKIWGRHAPPTSRLLRNIPEINREAARAYGPPPYRGRMTIFLATDVARPRPFDPERDLAGMSARDVEVVDVPGDHDSMLSEPFVGVLAERLDACLRRARTGG